MSDHWFLSIGVLGLLALWLLFGCAPIATIQCDAGPAWIGGHRLIFCQDGSVRWAAPDLHEGVVIREQRL